MRLDPRRLLGTEHPAIALGASAASLALATGVVALLEGAFVGIPDASPVYLVAVAFVAVRFERVMAVGSALMAFLLYNLLFTEPRFSILVADPRELLNLLLFLFVALVISRLAADAGKRTAEAEGRAREASALFAISRTLAVAPGTVAAASDVVAEVARLAGVRRAWLTRSAGGRELVVADTNPGSPLPGARLVRTLVRTPGSQPATWVIAHRPEAGHAEAAAESLYRIRVEADGEAAGWLSILRPRDAAPPALAETRVLALAADQLGLSLRRDALAARATDAEVARRSEALKSALLDTVSHDLRTPLAAIRAAAGQLLDPAVELPEEDRRELAVSLDAEAERLDRLVRTVLEASRIQAGAVRPDLELFDLEDLVRTTVERIGGLLGAQVPVIEAAPELPLVRVDAVLFDSILGNLLENAVRHAPGAPVRIHLAPDAARADRVAVTVEDGGPGVPATALQHLFEPFYRVHRRGEGARHGMGLGLRVVLGLVEAMGGAVRAERGTLGGLAVRLELPAAPAEMAE